MQTENAILLHRPGKHFQYSQAGKTLPIFPRAEKQFQIQTWRILGCERKRAHDSTLEETWFNLRCSAFCSKTYLLFPLGKFKTSPLWLKLSRRFYSYMSFFLNIRFLNTKDMSKSCIVHSLAHVWCSTYTVIRNCFTVEQDKTLRWYLAGRSASPIQ